MKKRLINTILEDPKYSKSHNLFRDELERMNIFSLLRIIKLLNKGYVIGETVCVDCRHYDYGTYHCLLKKEFITPLTMAHSCKNYK